MASALSNLTVRQLRERCRNAGLLVGGNKKTLIERLSNHLSAQSSNADSDDNPDSEGESESRSESESGRESDRESDTDHQNDDDDNDNDNDNDDYTKPPPKKRQKLDFKSQSNVNTKIIGSLDSDDDEEQDIDVKSDNLIQQTRQNDNNTNNNNNNNNNNINRNEIIRLNVGGIKYLTTRGTLLNFSSECGHMLSAMFSGDYLLTPNINNNEYFIDRNGKYFEYILAFLRNGNQFVDNMLQYLSKDTIVHLKQESKYFGLYDLIFDRFYAPISFETEFFSGTESSKEIRLDQDRLYVTHAIPKEWITHQRVIKMIFLQYTIDSNINNSENDDRGRPIAYSLTHRDADDTFEDIDGQEVMATDTQMQVTLSIDFHKKTFQVQWCDANINDDGQSNIDDSSDDNKKISTFDLPKDRHRRSLRVGVQFGENSGNNKDVIIKLKS